VLIFPLVVSLVVPVLETRPVTVAASDDAGVAPAAAATETTVFTSGGFLIDPATTSVGLGPDGTVTFSAPGVLGQVVPPVGGELEPGFFTVRDDGTTPWVHPSPCGVDALRLVEVLQVEIVGSQLLHFAARTLTSCEGQSHYTVMAYRATVPVDALVIDPTDEPTAVVRVGQRVTQPLLVHNVGSTAVHPTVSLGTDVISGQPVAGLSVSAASCAGGVAPGASCAFEIAWEPPAVGGGTVEPRLSGEHTSWSGRPGQPTRSRAFIARAAPPPGDAFEPLAQPVRVLDTRLGGVPLGQEPLRVEIAGRAGIPADATAVLANVTVTEPSSSGFVTLSPTGLPRPEVSNVNFLAGQTVANSSLLALGLDGGVDVFNSSGRTHVLIDVVGWLSPFADLVYQPLAEPARILDTRDPASDPRGAIGAGEFRAVDLEGTSARQAVSFVVNLTVTEPTADTHVSAVRTGGAPAPPPTTSTLNVVAGETRANLAVTGSGLTIYNNSGRAHVVIDLLGVFVPGGELETRGRIVPLVPFRAVDTRLTETPFAPGEAGGFTAPPTIGTPPLPVDGIIMNATVTEPTDRGFLTMFPWDARRIPVVSTLNFVAGQTVPNQAWARLARPPNNVIGLLNGSPGSTHIVLDVQAVVLG
jgi:hypothetical protein